jgi:flagellar basal-body rod modification protein FlgD
MTDISTVSGTSGMFSMTAGSISSLEDNYDLFLSVLTAQIQNQNPLDPTDASEMTNQLVNYSQVEQQILTNDFLQNLVLSTNNESAAVASAWWEWKSPTTVRIWTLKAETRWIGHLMSQRTVTHW